MKTPWHLQIPLNLNMENSRALMPLVTSGVFKSRPTPNPENLIIP